MLEQTVNHERDGILTSPRNLRTSPVRCLRSRSFQTMKMRLLPTLAELAIGFALPAPPKSKVDRASPKVRLRWGLGLHGRVSAGPQPSGVVRNSGKIDSLILYTSKRTIYPVNFNDRTEMLLNARRRVPTHVLVVDPHDSASVRTFVDCRLKGTCYDGSFSVVLITTTECAVNSESHRWHK